MMACQCVAIELRLTEGYTLAREKMSLAPIIA